MTISDINECELGGIACTQGCRNLNGSYVCTCNPGYQLGTDGKSCYRTSLYVDILSAFYRFNFYLNYMDYWENGAYDQNC